MRIDKLFMILMVIILFAGCSKPLQHSPQKDQSYQQAPKVVTTNDPHLSSEIVSSWGRQKDIFLRGNFTILEWEDAKELLLKKTYRSVFQYHTGWLRISTHDGEKYLVKKPQNEDCYQFMKEHNLSTRRFGLE